MLKRHPPFPLLAGCAATNPPPPPDFTSYVVLGEYGAAVARVLIDAPPAPRSPSTSAASR
jgi:hypothetical protein